MRHPIVKLRPAKLSDFVPEIFQPFGNGLRSISFELFLLLRSCWESRLRPKPKSPFRLLERPEGHVPSRKQWPRDPLVFGGGSKNAMPLFRANQALKTAKESHEERASPTRFHPLGLFSL